eukprot:CAMPEP_0185747550 /NCGR_PEP_ID=MMETSP1174-20130828/6171_1 /TAXON_ID=35687 /ORGANISM="Dictyocha speculum, Strain CCMP1381" /LENGTH=153 /DNA_ID=CAMNT_0028422773 /DNA_START=138 /DNA_END=595 /DNA_ORIENTATION=+
MKIKTSHRINCPDNSPRNHNCYALRQLRLSFLLLGFEPEPCLRDVRFVRIERLVAVGIIDAPSVRDEQPSDRNPHGCGGENLASKRHLAGEELGNGEEDCAPDKGYPRHRSTQSPFNVIHRVPRIADTQMQHQGQDRRTAEDVAIPEEEEGRR